MKGKTIGYIKGVQNVGDCTAVVDLKVGMGVVLDRAAQTANLPASADEAKACYRIADYEVSTDYDTIAVGDTLVFGTDGLLTKGGADGYKVYFEVTKKTAYMGKGLLVVVRVQ